METYPPLQKLYRTILNAFVKSNKRSKPKLSSNWKLPKRGCGCGPCVVLDKFLIDPVQQTLTRPLKRRDKPHLKHQLYADIQANSILFEEINDEEAHKADSLNVRIEKKNRAYDKDAKAWTQHCQALSTKISNIGREQLIAMLGKDSFNLA